MSDYRRWRVAGGAYFFTVVTERRQPLLTTPHARRALRSAIRRVQQRRPFALTAIVLLPDHLHAIWELPPGDADYSTRWRKIKTLVSRAISPDSRVPGRTASQEKRQEKGIWQRRFFEHTCRDEDDLKRCADYIHYNPVKHGAVERVKDWPWSSFHRFDRAGEYDLDWGSAPLQFRSFFDRAEVE